MPTITCPTCSGPVDLVGDKPSCLIGHEFDPVDLYVQVSREAESALWSAIRSLEDTASAARWHKSRPHPPSHLDATIERTEREALLIRDLLDQRKEDDSDAGRRPDGW